MKELVYHRHLLPAVERYTNKVGFIDGDYRGTYERHLDRVARLCAAPRASCTFSVNRFASIRYLLPCARPGSGG